MTRKRKNVESSEASEWKSTEVTERRNWVEEGGKRQFPDKKKNRNNDNYQRKQFEAKYGYVGGDDDGGGESEDLSNSISKDQSQERVFPIEIITYLRSIEAMIETEGKIEDFILDKCAAECSGSETVLLSFTEACVVVEKVFGQSAHGAALFLGGICRLKHRVIIDLLYSGCAARTIQNLLYALAPIEKNEHIEILSKLIDILCENWRDVVMNMHSAFLIRSLARISCGLPSKTNDSNNRYGQSVVEESKFANKMMKSELIRLFEKIATLALDTGMSGDLLDHAVCSLVVQDVIDADGIVKTGKTDTFIEKSLSNKGEVVINGWKGKNTSRIWEKAVSSCDEKMRNRLWKEVISANVQSLANHGCANFVLQKFISSITSEETAKSVCGEMIPLISELLNGNSKPIVISLMKCASRHEELQQDILKQLRQFFDASKVSNKQYFLFNVLTFNAYDKRSFDVEKSQVQGSLILDALFKFSKIKTLSACLESLTNDDVWNMALHRTASHVLQSALMSPSVQDDIKLKIIAHFESDWESLISNQYGSHVFESIWDCTAFTVAKQQDLLKKILPIKNTSRFWKFAMLRCNLMLFRKDRKAWVEEMKKKKRERNSQ